MTETMCDSGAVKLKAGTNVNSSITAEQYTQLINQAESYINIVTKKDFTTAYSGLSDAYKKILEDTASSHAAVGAINFDMSGYTSRAEAQTMLDVNWSKFQDNVKLLSNVSGVVPKIV